MNILRAVFLAVLTQAAAPQLPGVVTTATVRGTIRRLDTRVPLASATVELRRIDGSPPQTYSAITAGDGSFELSNVRPGDYRLAASRAGFLATEYGQGRAGGTGVTLSLTAGQRLEDVQAFVSLPGVIAGRITDSDGDPMGAAEVTVFTRTYQDGRRVLKPVQSDTSNDLGEYRIFGLIPGQYLLGVRVAEANNSLRSLAVVLAGGEIRLSAPNALGLSAFRGSVYVPIYYPGTADVRSAAPLNVSAGSNLLGVDFSIAPLKAHQVRGNVPGGGANVTLASVDPIDGGTSTLRTADAANGSFTVEGVPPGPYLVVARSGDLNGSVRIEVRDADVEGVTVAIGTGVVVPVHASFDNHAPLESDPDFENVYFALTPDPPLAGLKSDTYAPFPDGTFGFEVMAGEGYRISLTRSLPGHYIKAAHMGDRDVLNDGLVYNNEPDAKIEIVIGTRPGNLTGSVVDNAKHPSINATVVLVPDGAARHRASAYRTTSSDVSGRFEMSFTPPGDYTLFAWEDVESGVWQDPDFIKQYEGRGVRVHIADGSRENVTVPIIPAP